jgi:ABC-type glycerol-3-phosphate transport system permease component
MAVALYYAVLVVAAAAFILPIVWLVLGSLKLNAEFRAYPIVILPRAPILGNYYDALTLVPFFVYVGRSLWLASLYTTLVVASSALVGFGFARHRARGRNLLFILVVAMVMVPQIVTIIPQFMLYSRLRLVGTYWPWVLWGISGSPFHIFLFRQFFAGFPKELEDAAELDGCSRLRVFSQIFLPNAGPVLAASAIFAFQWVWGDFFLQSIFLGESHATLAMKLASSYVDPHGNPLYTQTLAAVVIYVLPLIMVFFLAQKQIMRGVVTTGLK